MGLTGLSSGFAYLSKLSHLCSEASQQPWHFGSGGPLLWALGPLDTGALPILHTPGVTAKTACRHGPAESQPLIATEAGLDSDSAFAQESLVVSCAAVSLGPHTRGLFVPPPGDDADDDPRARGPGLSLYIPFAFISDVCVIGNKKVRAILRVGHCTSTIFLPSNYSEETR